MKQRKDIGFTIVELLIVIVVIAILAAITIVAYNGIQNRSHDTAVQSDLRNMGNRALQALLDSADHTTPPTADQAGLENIIKVARASYNVDSVAGQFAFCRDDTNFVFIARSKSKSSFMFRSADNGVKSAPSWNGNLAANCTDATRGNLPAGTYTGVWLLHPTYGGDNWATWIHS